MQLLEQIEQTGSITQAAKSLSMSYRAAWNAVDALRNLAGEALLVTQSGGSDGGGTRLTPAGKRLLHTHRAVQEQQRRFMSGLHAQLDHPDILPLLRRFAVKTSARNQFFGTVTGIRLGAVNAEVTVALNDRDRLVATVTMESLGELQLGLGSEVWTLVTAPSVMVMPDDPAIKLSARNRLCGTVSRITRGAVNSDVVIDLPGGSAVSAIITNDSLDSLALAVGTPACAVFKAGSVILGVNA
ncbi:MAG TPA: TOBE domain-containing protein [Pseudomonadales bacterium]|nr:TOBE domain-containing protein [Pseudomonadales bacterium]HMZ91643.1 TOBE domain-containing protein [Pseudomonadales bacterium]HNC76656.1 TOBE domain-containing protein [Pseudomonadales bacterium]HNI64901.1 TOBE domain-containing protein [Pseudomonadales bacterium]HNV54184.1 TOBE domain-containing protein [Pseudomonadales bacterium]